MPLPATSSAVDASALDVLNHCLIKFQAFLERFVRSNSGNTAAWWHCKDGRTFVAAEFKKKMFKGDSWKSIIIKIGLRNISVYSVGNLQFPWILYKIKINLRNAYTLEVSKILLARFDDIQTNKHRDMWN